MASEKDAMMSSARYYINIVTTAKNACDSASRNMISPLNDVSGNWVGASGTAMAQALYDLQREIIRAYARLGALETQMNNRAWSVYNNWPEETADHQG